MTDLKKDINLIRRGLKYIRRLAPGNMAIKLIKGTVNAVLPFIDLYLSARIIDVLIRREGIKQAILYAVILVLLHLALTLISELLEIKNYEMFNGLYRKYNMMISNKIMSLDYAQIEDPETHIKAKNIEDAMKISNYGLIKLHSRIPLLYQNFLSSVLSVILIIDVLSVQADRTSQYSAIINSPVLVLVLIATILMTALVSVFSNSRIAAKTYDQLGIFSRINRVYDYYLNHYIAGHKAGKDIRLYEQYYLIADEIAQTNKKSCGIVDRISRTDFGYGALNTLAMFVLMIISYLYIGLKSLSGAISVGSIVKYSGAIMQFGGSVRDTVDAFSQLRSNSPYLKAMIDFMEQNSEMYKGTLTVEKRTDHEYNVEFRDVSFRYPNSDTYALRHVDLKFNIGEKLAIVGMNGSGKTTFIKLLCRLYDPTEGEILLNGVNIKKYDYDEYMSVFSVVFQDFRLFSFGLGQNVAASSTFDEARVEECLIKAGFGDRLATMPDGVKTILYKDFDKNGVEISGGEAQKIALARALYKDAPFIILDEPTAALDPISEYEIYSKFNDIAGEKTAIYISHRLSSCRFCDKIAVFHNGQIVQRGSHDELVADENGKYYELWTAQAQYYTK